MSTPAPSATRARVDAVASGASDPGPSCSHHLHGAIQLGRTSEIRVTTQPARVGRGGGRESARLVVRCWHQRPDGAWWPVAAEPGIVIHDRNVEDFAKAVAEAAAHLGAGGIRGGR